MKKIILMFISCLVLASLPLASFAEKKIYVTNSTSPNSSGPKRDLTSDIITVDVNQETCELCVTCNSNVSSIHITLSKAGVTYEEDVTSAVSGQTFVYSLAGYDDGDYDLVIEIEGVVVAVFTVTVEE